MAPESKGKKRGPGRPPDFIPPIPDTFENVIKALVKPTKKERKPR